MVDSADPAIEKGKEADDDGSDDEAGDCQTGGKAGVEEGAANRPSDDAGASNHPKPNVGDC